MDCVSELESAVDQLHAVPLEDFVAERKRLAKELRSAGGREAAAELAKLPKPSAPAWALNHLARAESGAVGAWLEAAEALRVASAGADRSSGDALRAAMAAHRDATRSLLAAVRDETRPNGRELSEPMLDRVRDLLQAATVDPAAAERLRAGRVVEGDGEAELQAPAEESGAQARGSKSRAASGAAKSKSRESKGAAAEERAAKEREAREAEARAELERLVAQAEERVGALRQAADEAEDAAEKAAERLEEAQRTLHRSESEAAAAREAADEAAEAADQAERELRTLKGKLSS
jgi:hypothetical protein